MEILDEGLRRIFEERENEVEGSRRLLLDLWKGRKVEDMAKKESI